MKPSKLLKQTKQTDKIFLFPFYINPVYMITPEIRILLVTPVL